MNGGGIKSFEILDITMEEKRVDTLTQYLHLFEDKYDTKNIAKLPDKPIRMGYITVRNNDTSNGEQATVKYMFLLDDFNITLSSMYSDTITKGDVNDHNTKQYTFMLIIPSLVVENKINSVRDEVQYDIFK